MLSVALIVSLVINFLGYHKDKREHDYIHTLYSDMKADILLANDSLDTPGSVPINYQKGAVYVAQTADIIRNICNYETTVGHLDLSEPDTRRINEVANYMSYVSFALLGEATKFLPQYPKNNKNPFITVNKAQARDFMIKVENIVSTNSTNNTISDDKVNTVFQQIDNLIPSDIRTQTPILSEFDYE